MIAGLINGVPIDDPQRAVSAEDRGLSYGHGVFETMRLHNGVVRFLNDHLSRMELGCVRLSIESPSRASILGDVDQLSKRAQSGVIKIVVTRGAGGRGYRASNTMKTTRLAVLYSAIDSGTQPIAMRWCTTRLARNPQLAGIKHLNRLEQVLAQNEWQDPEIAEGLMLDMEGEVVSGIACNLFIVRDGILSTPDLRFCGVRGVMRQQVLHMAKHLGIRTHECGLRIEEVAAANELFVTNAVRGIRPVNKLGNQQWSTGPVTKRLIEMLELDQ